MKNTFRPGWIGFALIVATANAAEPDPNRLGHVVVPLAQTIELAVDPAAETYTGRVRIDIRVTQPVTTFRLHAKELTLQSAELFVADASMALKMAVTEPAIGILTLESPTPIPAGLHGLELTFENDFDRSGIGIYKTTFRDAPYLFTQMEAVHARAAFPCWDDPEYKIPWQLTVTAPSPLAVVSNTPVAYSETRGASTIWRFGRTRPMPSYLVALAVGPLEFVPVSGLAIPGRIVTARGQAGLAGEIARLSPGLLTGLQRYFGVPYPYEKLDQIAVPEFVFGGMENAGAITYRDSYVLFPPDNLSFSQHKRLAEIVAHEMAHMWFGDLVTMRWWTDLWLNESFATWISYKIVGQVLPKLSAEVERVRSVHEAMTLDSQAVVEPIRRELRAGGDIMSLIDALTYNKGQAVLDMTEAWLGEEVFRKAMQDYFRRHAWGSTDAADLWQALDHASGQNISGIVTPFITQPGIPFLEFEIGAGDRVKISQTRFHTLTGSASRTTWSVPVFIRYGVAGERKRHRVLLSESSAEFTLPGISGAEWICVNDAARGYYRWSLPVAWLGRLTRVASTEMSLSERLNVIDNAGALFAAGRIDGATIVEAIAAVAGDADADVADKAAEELATVLRIFVRPDNRSAVAAALQRVWKPVVSRIGWEPKRGEPEAIAPLRSRLLVILGEMADDPAAVAAARDITRRIFAGDDVNAELRRPGLRVSAAHGDEALLRAMMTRIAGDLTPPERQDTLQAFGGFREPALVDLALAFALTDQIKSTETALIPYELSQAEENRKRVVEWLIRNHDVLAKRIPELHYSRLLEVADGNDPGLAKRLGDFTLDPARVTPAAVKQAGLIAERVTLRARLREREQEAVDRALSGLGATRPD
jgi:alanyl aminopeptidase